MVCDVDRFGMDGVGRLFTDRYAVVGQDREHNTADYRGATGLALSCGRSVDLESFVVLHRDVDRQARGVDGSALCGCGAGKQRGIGRVSHRSS